MIAKLVPTGNIRGTKSEVAAMYGLSLAEFSAAAMDFLQSEGYDDDGREYPTLHAWLTTNRTAYRDPTPWQKGDNEID